MCEVMLRPQTCAKRRNKKGRRLAARHDASTFVRQKDDIERAATAPKPSKIPSSGKRAAKKAASIRPQRFRQARLRPLPVFAQSRAPFLFETLANSEESLKIASVNANFRFCSHIGQLSLAYSPCRKETPPPTGSNAFRGASPCAPHKRLDRLQTRPRGANPRGLPPPNNDL